MRELIQPDKGATATRGGALVSFVATVLLTVLGLTGCAGVRDGSYAAEYQSLGELNSARAERVESIVACLDAAGFPGAVIQEDGSTAIDLSEDQIEPYNEAAAECLAEACPACGKPLSEQTLERLYNLQVEAGRCLRAAGFSVSDPPSLQSYFESQPEARWSPHREIAQQLAASGRSAQLAEECPDPETYITYW